MLTLLTVGEQNKVHVRHGHSGVYKTTDHLHEWLDDKLKTCDSVECAKEQDG